MQLTQDQACAINAVDSFLRDKTLDAFVLRGSAGTGKTTLIAKIVDLVAASNMSCALLAPTGRAARILGNKVRQITRQEIATGTIHSAIYSLKHLDVNEEAQSDNDPGLRLIFPLKEEEPSVRVFIIDEASMVGDREAPGDFVRFGSGRLLKDIISYSRMQRPGREGEQIVKLLFVGDPAQLPPVGENISPALCKNHMTKEYRLRIVVHELEKVMRQSEGSGILERATTIRQAISKKVFNSFSMNPNRQDVVKIEGNQALDRIETDINERKSAVIVVHSNATALDYNRSIRARLWGNADQPVRPRDTLLINRNSQSGLRNGDLVQVLEVARAAEKYNVPIKGNGRVELSFRSAEVDYCECDGTVVRLPCLLLENLLDSRVRELSPLEQRALLVHFRMRHPDLPPRSDEFRLALLHDRYFNALQVKYGYAMTCHKAQGGEWDTAYVDFHYGGGYRNASFFRWAYTAITRAKQRLYVIGAPGFDEICIKWSPSATNSSGASSPFGTDPTKDTDWNRLSFSAATAPLMPTHQRLRENWDSHKIIIEQLQHLQYCERYSLVRRDSTVNVQYYYNKKFQIVRHGPAPGENTNQDLLNEALEAFNVINEAGTTAEQPDQFIQDFLDHLDVKLSNSPLKRSAFKTSMPYRLRVSFSDTIRQGDIDFIYDGSMKWTAAQEVGGPGASDGIYDEVRLLMDKS